MVDVDGRRRPHSLGGKRPSTTLSAHLGSSGGFRNQLRRFSRGHMGVWMVFSSWSHSALVVSSWHGVAVCGRVSVGRQYVASVVAAAAGLWLIPAGAIVLFAMGVYLIGEKFVVTTASRAWRACEPAIEQELSGGSKLRFHVRRITLRN